MTPAETTQLNHNLVALRNTFTILGILVQEQVKEGTGVGQCNALTLSVAQKLVYERFEREKSRLGIHAPPTCFTPPAEPILTEETRQKVLKEIHESAFYKAAWGSRVTNIPSK